MSEPPTKIPVSYPTTGIKAQLYSGAVPGAGYVVDGITPSAADAHVAHWTPSVELTISGTIPQVPGIHISKPFAIRDGEAVSGETFILSKSFPQDEAIFLLGADAKIEDCRVEMPAGRFIPFDLLPGSELNAPRLLGDIRWIGDDGGTTLIPCERQRELVMNRPLEVREFGKTFFLARNYGPVWSGPALNGEGNWYTFGAVEHAALAAQVHAKVFERKIDAMRALKAELGRAES